MLAFSEYKYNIQKNPIKNKLLSSNQSTIEISKLQQPLHANSFFRVIILLLMQLGSIFASRLRLLIYAIRAHAVIQYENRIEVNTVYMCAVFSVQAILYVVRCTAMHTLLYDELFFAQYILIHI